MLVYGPPGAGKSTFLTKLLSHNILDQNRPALVVLSDREPEAVVDELGRNEPVFKSRSRDLKLQFLDAYRGTVGVFSETQGFKTASCADLNNFAITMGNLVKSIGSRDLVIIFDSLTPIYLMNGANAIKFIQSTLMRYAAAGQRVIVAIDEGCGKQEDIVAMMTLAAAVVRLYTEDSRRIVQVVKYPGVAPTKFPIATAERKQLRCRVELTKGTESYQTHYAMVKEIKSRPLLDDWVDILWTQLVLYGGLAWDPIRFPRLLYELSKDVEAHCLNNSKSLWTEEDHRTIGTHLEELDIHDPQNALAFIGEHHHSVNERYWHGAPLEATSTKDLLRYRKEESALCWGLPNVGLPLCFYDCGLLAGALISLDKEGCEWEVYEEQCVGKGGDSCIMALSTERHSELYESFSRVTCDAVAEIGQRIVNEIILRSQGQRTIPKRPRLGDLSFLALFQEVTTVPALSDDRYLIAMRMAGAKAGSEMANSLTRRGISDEYAARTFEEIYYAMKAGRMQIGETVRIFENCESTGIRIGESLCFFTTGLLNGFFTTKMNRNVRKTKCVGLNDRYCEWEFS